MIKFICETCCNNSIITKEMVYKNFRAIVLSNKLEHSEDNLFTTWKKFKQKFLI